MPLICHRSDESACIIVYHDCVLYNHFSSWGRAWTFVSFDVSFSDPGSGPPILELWLPPETPEAWCQLGTDSNYFLCKLLDASALLLPFTNWGGNHFLSYLTRLLGETLKSFDYEEHYILVKECCVLVIFHPVPRQYQVPCSPGRLVKTHNSWPGLWFSLLLLRCPAAGSKHPLIPSYIISFSWLFASKILAELLSLCIKLFPFT